MFPKFRLKFALLSAEKYFLSFKIDPHIIYGVIPATIIFQCQVVFLMLAIVIITGFINIAEAMVLYQYFVKRHCYPLFGNAQVFYLNY